MKRFSIIIPNYNGENTIKKCLNSIISQTYNKDNYEIIVVDDESTDNSINILNKYEDVNVFQIKHACAGGARNRGLDVAKGEYIIFLDNDDNLYDDYCLEKLSNLITNEDIINLNFEKKSIEGNYIQMQHDKMSNSNIIEKSVFLGCPTRCYKSSILKSIRFMENITYEDITFTIEALCNSNIQTYYESPFFCYNKKEKSITTSKVEEKQMIDLIIQISSLYYLCGKYKNYRKNILNRIINDKLDLRLKILNEYLMTGVNNFREYFPLK